MIENALLFAFRADTHTIDVPYAVRLLDIGFAFLAVPKIIAFAAAFDVRWCSG